MTLSIDSGRSRDPIDTQPADAQPALDTDAPDKQETEQAAAASVAPAPGQIHQRPPPEAIDVSREALRHDPRTAHLRAELDQRLDAGPQGHEAQKNQRSLVSEKYDNIQKSSEGNDKNVQATPEGFVSSEDGSTFTGTGGDDSYTVEQAGDGSLTVSNDASGSSYTISGAEAEVGVVINLQGGDDRLSIGVSVSYDLMVQGGDGDDVVDGSNAVGQLTLRGGNGDDLLIGGYGADSIDGGAGDDELLGMYGNDQLNGQAGDDWLLGGRGHDFLNGGAGSDELDGDAGLDAIYSDADDHRVDAGGGDGEVDIIIAEDGSVAPMGTGAEDVVLSYDPDLTQAWLDAHPEFDIDGDEDFVARTTADIGVMLATQQGRGVLEELSDALLASGQSYQLVEKSGVGGLHNGNRNVITVGNFAGAYSAEGAPRHPLPILFHELVHAFQTDVSGRPAGMTQLRDGTAVNNIELEATGLPWIDAEGNLHGSNELRYTDNLFRQELGLPLRAGYGGSVSEPDMFVESDEHGHGHEHH